MFLFSLQIYEELSVSQYLAFFPSNVMFFQYVLMQYQSGAKQITILLFVTASKVTEIISHCFYTLSLLNHLPCLIT